ncbi:MAG: hypothetical protein OXE99_14000 [Cellvibrionales bacterium]|nr:hypothetical protein [Cellvibrionales bacterium]
MPRPSLKLQRVDEILNALESCILAEGLSSTSLETIATTANMKRSILRHYIGNRDDIIIALGQRFFKQSQAQWQTLLDQLPETHASQWLVEGLLFFKDTNQLKQYQLSEALFAEARRLPELKDVIGEWTERFINDLTYHLAKDYPKTTEKACRQVALGLYSLYFLDESYTALFPKTPMTNDLQATALRLIQSLSA